MHFSEEQTVALCDWLQNDLVNICDADPKVLSDYILALLKHDTGVDELKQTCLESLAEFIGNGECGPFIDRLFVVLLNESYMDSGMYRDHDMMDVEMTPAEERRRNYNRSPRGDRDYGRHDDRRYDDRRMEDRRFDDRRDRRGGRFGRDDSDRYHGNHHEYTERDFDRRVEVRSRSSSQRKRCFTFDEKGYCPRGFDCHFEHIPKEESRQLRRSGFDRDRGSSRGGRGRGRGGRGGAFLSRTHSQGPQKILVVENIPEEYANVNAIKDYFSRFGALVNTQLDADSKSAMLEYSSHDEAKACYSSPDAIFSNRFVKVYWSGMESISPPQPTLTKEELQANLRRMKEKKLEADSAALEKQKQLTEIQRNRAALISKLMQEQTTIMEKLKTDSNLSVQERAVMMKGLESVQESIKSLMKETVNSPHSKPLRNPSFPARPYNGGTFRPSFQKPHRSDRKFVLDPNAAPFFPSNNTVSGDPVYHTKLEAFEQLQRMVHELGDQADPQVLTELSDLKQELDQYRQRHQSTKHQGLYKLDLRSKSFVFNQITMDSEEVLANYYSAFAGFLGVGAAENGRKIVVHFKTRANAELAISSVPDGFSRGVWFNQE